jgi:chitinase
MAPEDIPLGYYTHINFAFALVNPSTFHIEDMGPDTAALYDRVSALKSRDPNLQVWIGTFITSPASPLDGGRDILC